MPAVIFTLAVKFILSSRGYDVYRADNKQHQFQCLSNEYTRAGKINNDVMGRAQRQGAPWLGLEQGLGLLEQALLLMWQQACLAPCCPPPVR